MRCAEVKRETRETNVKVFVALDGSLDSSVNTGLPFLDHMLDAFACHGRLSLRMTATGDLEVDPHHLVEDCGAVLGRALAEAQGQSPVRRAGYFLFPMDGSLASVAVDLCGRPNLVWNVTVGEGLLGGVAPGLFRDFFKALVDGLRATVHVNVPYQDGDHHALEAVFKAWGRAFASAAETTEVPLSTKGTIDA